MDESMSEIDIVNGTRLWQDRRSNSVGGRQGGWMVENAGCDRDRGRSDRRGGSGLGSAEESDGESNVGGVPEEEGGREDDRERERFDCKAEMVAIVEAMMFDAVALKKLGCWIDRT